MARRIREHLPGTKIVRTDGWVLGRCTACRMTNYVEPHGITAECRGCGTWTPHDPIEMTERDAMTRERFAPIPSRKRRPR